MAALTTVADYLAKARTLLQDEIAPYRYSDNDLVDSLNQGIQESRRVRPDMWLGLKRSESLPSYDAATPTTVVAIDPLYRMAFVYYMTGQAQLTDQEDTDDQRAMAFLGKFGTILSGSGGQ